MRLEIDKEGTFIPEFKGNKKLSPTEQIQVRYRTPTLAIKNRCRKKPETKAISDSNGGIKHMEVTVERNNVETLTSMLISISNCSYGPEEKPNIISSAQDLLNAPIDFEPLLNEIVKEFDRILDQASIDEKN